MQNTNILITLLFICFNIKSCQEILTTSDLKNCIQYITNNNKLNIIKIFVDDCPHCAKAKETIDEIVLKYKEIASCFDVNFSNRGIVSEISKIFNLSKPQKAPFINFIKNGKVIYTQHGFGKKSEFIKQFIKHLEQ
ncbi:MAG: hypothetical protein K2X39_09670 [Silvanigrellaceae bacterium]|nr:hypothetical protein [Silvanigrellaceae bacterium]